jgi:dihydroxyacetone kinase
MTELLLSDIERMIGCMANTIIKNEVYFCELDSVAGDGDFGMSLAKGFKRIRQEWNDLDRTDIGAFLKGCALIITEHCGGASGPIWGTAFSSAARVVKGKEALTLAELVAMMDSAAQGIQKRGGAQPGDKTLLDALIPAVDSLKSSANEGIEISTALKSAADVAAEGAEKTKEMVAKRGRASYVGERSIHYPDAGAMALGIIFRDIADLF